ncbi:hypothetical protein F5Y16DRAFT_403550 [Xylariaceae sp. FL0255]|nr:hypothetical protein F5Y16DRAFT_403550 [Xylariaceae sp. FL0255]
MSQCYNKLFIDNDWLFDDSSSEIELIQLTPTADNCTDLIRAFGDRMDDDKRVVHGYRWWYTPDTPEEEFGYNIRFYEPNHRQSGCPWSLRHTGVYQKLNFATLDSTWVLLQPSAELSIIIESYLRLSSENKDHPLARTLHIHAAIVSHAIQTWVDYIDYIYSKLDELSEKAYHSRVGKPTLTDYSVHFQDCQRIEMLRVEVLRASRVLDSSVEIVRGCQLRAQRLSRIFCIEVDLTVQNLLKVQEHELQGYKSTFGEILERMKGVSRLLEKILESRHDETMRKQTQLLTDLARDQARTNDKVAELQDEMAKESRLLKSLTIMATLYLPASLVLSFFGSNLVQAQDADQSGKSWNIVLVQEAWLAIVAPAPLVLATLVFILWIGRTV